IKQANNQIQSHNEMVLNIDAEKENLTSQIWGCILNILDIDLNKYLKDKERLVNAIHGMKNSLLADIRRVNDLDINIKEYEKQVISTIATPIIINKLLESFGFTSFSIKPHGNTGQYKICRENGADASRSLSEGEKTFIT